jgi:hypothetical protein
MGIDCFDSDKEALYGEKIYENKKIRLTETELHEIVKSSVKQVVNEISYGMARRAYQASTDRGDWQNKPSLANNLFSHLNDRASQNFDPNIDVVVVGGEGQGNYKAGDLEQYFEITGYVEPNPNPLYNNNKRIGAPKIKGYYGPFCDGDCLRYESPDVYDMLSR